MSRDRYDAKKWLKIERFQKAEIAKLANLSVNELLKLPVTQDLAPPESLPGEKFLIRRKRVSKGTYEISVAYEIPSDPAVIASIEGDYSALGFGEVKIGAGYYSQYFALLPDGSICWPDEDVDGDD